MFSHLVHSMATYGLHLVLIHQPTILTHYQEKELVILMEKIGIISIMTAFLKMQ